MAQSAAQKRRLAQQGLVFPEMPLTNQAVPVLSQAELENINMQNNLKWDNAGLDTTGDASKLNLDGLNADNANPTDWVGWGGLALGGLSSIANYNLQDRGLAMQKDQLSAQKDQFGQTLALKQDELGTAKDRLGLAYAKTGRTYTPGSYS